jgi:hypothetical protein
VSQNDAPNSWDFPHVHLCSTTSTCNSTDLLSHCVTQENHPKYHLNSLHKGGQHNVQVLSHIGTTHPSHGHTQLMGSLSGRLTQSVSWRVSHVAVIINTTKDIQGFFSKKISSRVKLNTCCLSWLLLPMKNMYKYFMVFTDSSMDHIVGD